MATLSVDTTYVNNTFFANVPARYKLADLSAQLSAAQAALETEIGIASFDTVSIVEKNDYYLQNFRDTFWMMQLRHSPIKAITAYEIWWGQQKIGDVDVSWLVLDTDSGTLELVPNALGASGLMYMMLMEGLSNIVPGFVTYDRLPLAFHVTYTAGWDYTSRATNEQAWVKYAVARRAAIMALPVMEPMGQSNQNISIDGASQSTGFSKAMFSTLLERLVAEDKVFVDQMQRKLGKEFEITVI